MLINILLSFLLSLLSVYSGCILMLRYRDVSSFFYLVFSLLLPFWFLLNTMWYSNFATPNLMEVVYKVQYSISLIWFYSIIFFVLFYRSKNISKKILYTIFAWYFVSIALLNFTDLFLWSVDFSLDEGKYVENYGPLYSLLVGAYILIFPLFFLISWFKIRRLSYLDKSRLNIIIVGFILLIGLPLIFQVISFFFTRCCKNLMRFYTAIFYATIYIMNNICK